MATITGTIRRVEYIDSSVYGNPYYRVAIETTDGEIELLRTQINAGFNYAINNAEYREGVHEFTLSKAGRITGVKR